MLSGSTWGNHIQISLYGESHGHSVGAILSGIPAGEQIDIKELEQFIKRRCPGENDWVSPRKESDKVCFESGFHALALTDESDKKLTTTGSPITGFIFNDDAQSQVYRDRWRVPRPGHADYTAQARFGTQVNLLGGGYLSARNTAAICMAGGIAKQVLSRRGVRIAAHLRVVGSSADFSVDPVNPDMDELEQVAHRDFPTISHEAASRMRTAILNALNAGDSVGGQVECVVTGLPAGLGSPRFMSVESLLSSILFAIPAVKAVSFGEGFKSSRLLGSVCNDPFSVIEKNGRPELTRLSNHAGGVEGGITNGMPLIMEVGFKPTSSIGAKQQSVDLETMEPVELSLTGRHDPCVAVRAVPVVEAVCALALADLLAQHGYLKTQQALGIG